MRLAQTIALLGLLAMTGVLTYGFTVGDFAAFQAGRGMNMA